MWFGSRGQISPVWTGSQFRPFSILSSQRSDCITQFIAGAGGRCWLRLGRFYHSLSEYWVVPPRPTRQMNAFNSQPCTTLPPTARPQGTTRCPLLKTRESAWKPVFDQKRQGFGNLQVACVFYDKHLSSRQTLQLRIYYWFYHVTRFLSFSVSVLCWIPKLLFDMFPVVCDQLTLLADHCAQCGIHASTWPSRQTWFHFCHFSPEHHSGTTLAPLWHQYAPKSFVERVVHPKHRHCIIGNKCVNIG